MPPVDAGRVVRYHVGMDTLTADQIRSALADLPDWEPRDGAIGARYSFDSFPDAIAFVNRVAGLAEAAQHHPDLEIHYSRVEVELTTHSAGGVTRKDLDLAAQIAGAVT